MAVPGRFSHSRSLFITDLGPMRFYVRPGPLKKQLSQLITYGGGIMCRVQEPGAFLLANPGQGHGIQYMSSTYITDCVRSNRRLSPRAYRMQNRRDAGPVQPRAGALQQGHRGTLSPEGPHRARAGTHQSDSTGGRNPNPNITVCTPGTPGPCDPGPSTGTHRLCDPRTSNGIPVPCDPEPTTGNPVPCDPGPGNGTPAPIDHRSSHPGLNTGTPAPCDPGPSTVTPRPCDPRLKAGGSVMKDSGAKQLESRGHGDDPIGTGTHWGHSATEDHQTRCAKACTVLKSRASGRMPFCEQEDIVILQYVQENEGPKKLATGNLLWQELEKKQLVQRTWQTMKSRYKKHIMRCKHKYKLPPRDRGTTKTPWTSVDHCRNPSSAGITGDLTAPNPDPPPADVALRSASPTTAGSGGTRGGALCTDLSTDDDGSPSERHMMTLRLRSSTDATSRRGKEKKQSVSANKPLPVPVENQDSDHSEELQIFEIANMEFELDDEESGCKVKVPAISLKDFVMGEDSLSSNSQVNGVTSSPDVSDSQGLQDALTDLMSEFRLDISQVTQALLKNNGEVGSTRHFLQTGRRPDGFSAWEYKDDVVLKENDPALQVQLVKKYGADNVAKRVAFLAS
ncbi:telomeric repeat-binding factor 2-interacting protein 1 [Anomaloglossus baeobatrachus]|uniref:telomeric repeat-binding factor 2-interacting protein 1 n=1 Tax=Anomaloglossus baeobatrachus TaxID=238106 RepID=UPI003F4F9368